MPQYKLQHYLPAAYLKYFSADQTSCTRGSWIWRLDRHALRLVSIVSQCSGDYFYSKTKAVEVEQTFQRIESVYCQCVDKIKARKEPTPREYGNLVLAMFDFYLRNAVHKNQTAGEGIDAYKFRNHFFVREMLLGKKSGEVSQGDIVNHINSHWGIHVFSITPGHAFITSDHPALWVVLEPVKPGLHLLVLPLTPTHIAVAFDRRILNVVGNQLTVKDMETLNLGQIENAEKCVYASQSLTDDLTAIVEDHFATRAGPSSAVRETSWEFSVQGLPPEHYYSFIQRTPPLM